MLSGLFQVVIQVDYSDKNDFKDYHNSFAFQILDYFYNIKKLLKSMKYDPYKWSRSAEFQIKFLKILSTVERDWCLVDTNNLMRKILNKSKKKKFNN